MDLNYTLNDINAAAARFLETIQPHKVIAFNGEMGAGKTTFIHALCAAMGVTETVSSPTFSIINQYRNAAGEPVYHIDLYRLKDEEEAIQAGVEDCLYSGDYCLVEWPSKAGNLFPENTLYVHIEVLNNETRRLTINP